MRIEDEFGEFPGGCAIVEAVEVGVFLYIARPATYIL